MSCKLFYTLLVSGGLLVSGISQADRDPGNTEEIHTLAAKPAAAKGSQATITGGTVTGTGAITGGAAAAPAGNASFVPEDLAAKSHEEVATKPAKKHKKAKAAAVAKGSQATVTGTGTVTGPVSLTGGAAAAPAPATK